MSEQQIAKRFALSGRCDNGLHSECPYPDKCKCSCHGEQQIAPEATPRPSALAEAISEAIDSTSNHAELIDQVIEEHANILCSYCAQPSFKGRGINENGWTTEAKEAMAEHILSCPERPEAKLVAHIDTLKRRVKELEAWKESALPLLGKYDAIAESFATDADLGRSKVDLLAQRVKEQSELITRADLTHADAKCSNGATIGANYTMADAIKDGIPNMDWGQVVANGGPPCFAILSKKFCGRAERWAGHDSDHTFVPLRSFIANLVTHADAIRLIKEKRDEFKRSVLPMPSKNIAVHFANELLALLEDGK